MPIRIKFPDLDFGQVWYLKTDPGQSPHILVGLVILPGNQVMFQLSYMGSVTEAYDFECSLEPNSDIKQETE